MSRPFLYVLACSALVSCEAPTEGLGTLAPEPGLVVTTDPPCDGPLSARTIGWAEPQLRISFREPQAVLGPKGLYYSQYDGGGEALAHWDRSGENVLMTEASPSQRYLMLGGSKDGVAWAEGSVGSKGSTVLLLDAQGQSSRVQSTDSRVVTPGDNAPARQVVDQERVAYWTESTVEVAAPGEGHPFANLLPFAPLEAPYLRWPYLALTGIGRDVNNGQLRVYDLRGGWQDVLGLEGAIRNVILTEDSLLYLNDGRPMVAPLVVGAQPRSLGDRVCTSLDTDGERVVLACDPEQIMSWNGWIANNRSLWLYEEGTLRPIELRGRNATLPRIQGDAIVYLSYDETDFCQPGVEGQVMLHDLITEQTQALAPITHGCYCCDAYWPTSQLLFVGDLVAWNYDTSQPMGSGWGMAELSRTCPRN